MMHDQLFPLSYAPCRSPPIRAGVKVEPEQLDGREDEGGVGAGEQPEVGVLCQGQDGHQEHQTHDQAHVDVGKGVDAEVDPADADERAPDQGDEHPPLI